MAKEKIEMSRCRTAYLQSMHKNPCAHLAGYISLILLMTLVGTQRYEILYGENDISDPSAPAKIALDSVLFAQALFDNQISEEEELTQRDEFVVAYSWKDGRNEDILTAENLQAFCELEQIIFDQSDFDYKISFSGPITSIDSCDPDTANKTCVSTFPAIAITPFFYGQPSIADTTFSYDNCYLLDESKLNTFKEDVFFPLLEGQIPQRGLVNSLVTPTLTRSLVSISDPSSETLEKKALEIEEKFFEILGMEASFGTSAYRNEATYKNLNVIFVSDILVETEFNSLVPSDFAWIFGSIVFVFVWMRVYTKSWFLTITCVFYILLSIPVGIFLYKIILQILFFDFIHILAVFLVLGIGADGVFVVVDAWKQSADIVDDEFDRLAYTYSRSAATVFNTSFTTMFAFGVTGLSTLVPISTFGIFAALCIGVNYVFILTIIPTTILIWDRKFNQKGEVEAETKESTVYDMYASDKEGFYHLISKNNQPFEEHYVPFVLNHRKKLVAFGVLVGGLGMYGVTNVSQLTKPEQFLPEDHMFSKYIDTLSDSFLGGQEDEFALITVFWGIETIERDLFSHYTGVVEDYKDELIFDTNFDPADPAAQAAMIDLCETLLNETCSTSDCKGSTTLLLQESSEYTPVCTMKDFSVFWRNRFGTALEDNTDAALFNDRMRQFLEENESKYGSLIGFIDGELKYFAHTFRLTLPLFSIGPEKDYYENTLNDIMKNYEDSAPSTAKLVDYASGEFVQRAVEIALVSTVVRGLLITFPIVFLVMIFATRNAYLAFVSVTAILFIVITVLGFVFSVLEWELGIAESIVAIMIVGLSVDYCVHLGHMFTLAGSSEGYKSKADRFHFAALMMGPTVLAGGATTLGAGIFLFGCQIVFFTKMGALLTLTVCCSLFFSLFFLMPAATLFEYSDAGIAAIEAKQKANEEASL